MDLNIVALVVVLVLMIILLIRAFVHEARKVIRKEASDRLAKRLYGKPGPAPPKRPPPPKPKKVKYKRHRR